MLRGASRHVPLLLVVHDLHRCDMTTLMALRQLVDALGSMPVAMLMTRHSEDHRLGRASGLDVAMARASTLRIELEGMDGEEVRSLALASGLDLHPVEAERLRARTGGNPFLVRELAASSQPFADQLPAAVVDVMEHALESLPQDTTALLRMAAPGHALVEVSELARQAGRAPEVLRDELEPATSRGVITWQGTTHFTFVHGLVRELLTAVPRPA